MQFGQVRGRDRTVRPFTSLFLNCQYFFTIIIGIANPQVCMYPIYFWNLAKAFNEPIGNLLIPVHFTASLPVGAQLDICTLLRAEQRYTVISIQIRNVFTLGLISKFQLKELYSFVFEIHLTIDFNELGVLFVDEEPRENTISRAFSLFISFGFFSEVKLLGSPCVDVAEKNAAKQRELGKQTASWKINCF